MTYSPSFTPEATSRRRSSMEAHRTNNLLARRVAERDRYRAALARGDCGHCLCRPRLPGRVYCDRCYDRSLAHNRKRDADKPKRTCAICKQPGHYRSTCERGYAPCHVMRRIGVPCRSCAA